MKCFTLCQKNNENMVITKIFTNSFQSILLAKIRRFLRRSIFRYILAAVMISYGRYLLATINSDQLGSVPLSAVDIVIEGGVGFILLCLFVIILMVVAAKFQSNRKQEYTITFKCDELIVTQDGSTTHHDWDWIISAEYSLGILALLNKNHPGLEVFLPKSSLTEAEFETLQGWLGVHGKYV